MPPLATPTTATVLIIPLILNALSAPPPPTTWRAPMSSGSAPEIVYQLAPQPPPHDLSSSSDLPMDVCSGHFGMANATDSSSVQLLLMVSLPSQGDRPGRRSGGSSSNNNNITKASSNRTAPPWTTLPLEPGIYGGGTPQAREEPVCRSDASGLNISLDVGLFSLSDEPNSVWPMMPPMSSIDIEDRLISDHPPAAVGAPALFGFVLCSSDGKGSFVPTIFQHGQRYTRAILSGYRERAQPRKLLGAHGRNIIYGHRQGRVAAVVGFSLLALLCSAAGLVLCWWCTRLPSPTGEDRKTIHSADLWHSGPRRYSHCELAAATCGFSDGEKIGRGGFGPVYRGYLRDLDCHVAVKVPHQEPCFQEQGMREFQAEVKVMTRLRHRNIVQLLGWCHAPGAGGLMLVYEFLPNGSLDIHLHDPHRLLAWSDRYRIALGVGSAILYLHTECEQCVLHGDIKPANILLDASWSAKLGDFGMARLVDHGNDPSTTQVVAGTPGYIDPAFVNSQRPSAESNVYSFGVVLLEIACGKRPATRQANGAPPMLLNWVREMCRRDSVLGVADPRLGGEFDDQQMTRVLVAGLWCTHHDQSQRPSIAQVMDLLRRRDAELPILEMVMHSPDAIRSLEEIALHDMSVDSSAFENPTTETVYHSSKDSTALLECY